MSVKGERINGVTFVNPQYLKIEADLIQNCVFYSNIEMKRVYLILSGIAQKNLFIGFKGSIQITITELYIFTNNYIIDSYYVELKTNRELNYNHIINSHVHIKNLNKKLILIGNIFKNSYVQIKKQEGDEVQFFHQTLIKSQVYIEDIIYSLQIKQSDLINSQFIINQVHDNIRISDSYFYQDLDQQYMIPFTVMSSPNKIIINDSIIKGYFAYFMSDINQIDHVSSEKMVNIVLKNNTFKVNNNYNSNLSSLFNIPLVYFLYSISEGTTYAQIKVEEYNYDYSFLLIPSIFLLQRPYQMSQYSPSQYSIYNILCSRKYSIKFQIKENNKPKFVVNQTSQQVQILSFQIHQIQFLDLEDYIIDPNQLELKLIQNQPQQLYENYGIYHLTILFNQRQIQQVFISQKQEEQFIFPIEISESYQHFPFDNSIYFKKNTALNQIDIYWNQLKSNTILQIKIDSCDTNQLLQNQNCIPHCEHIESGFICSENCQEGFFRLENQGNCIKCNQGCKSCRNQLKCDICYPEYLLDDGLCQTTCSRNQYYSQQTCKNCIEDCNLCILDGNNYLQHQDICLQCEFAQFCYQKSLACDLQCKECSPYSKFDCLSCQKNRIYKFGKCLRKK